jgi:chemotaxis family two-component system response regulator Rcp1
MNGRPVTILQVEDTLEDAQLTAYAIKSAEIPHAIHVVTDGAQAIDFLKQSEPFGDQPRPDLILLDLELPKLNGSEVLEFIKADDRLRTIPVIIFSTADNVESKKHAYELHANSYVVKPMLMDEFVKKVQAIANYWYNTSD